MVSTEEILDLLSILILDLGSIREQTIDKIDRAAINNQITALTGLWRKIDDARASEANDQLNEAHTILNEISRELKQEKSDLQNVPKVIYRAAQATAVAEKVVKMVG